MIGFALLFILNLNAAFGADLNSLPFKFPDNAASITVSLSRDHSRLFAKASIDGIGMGYMMIDTGSDITMVGTDVALRLHLSHLGSTRVYGQQGLISADIVPIHRLQIGSLVLENVSAGIDPKFSYWTQSRARVSGIIGLDAIGRVPLMLNFNDATLHLYNPAQFQPPADAALFEIRQGSRIPLVRGIIEGNEDWFEIDSGETDSLKLSRAFVHMHPELIANRPMISEAVPWETPQNEYRTRWAWGSFLGKKFSPISGDFQVGADGINDFAGLLGANMLIDSRLTIDFASSHVWFARLPRQSPEDFMKIFDPKSQDLGGATSLLQAAYRNNADAIRALLKAGADPNVADELKITPLMVSAGRGDVDSTSLLLAAGAKVELHSASDGYTPLMLAAEYGRLETAKMLLDAGAQVDLPTDSGRTPLFQAVNSNFPEMAKFLLEHGAKVEGALPTGTTPLMAACRNGSFPCASLLLDHGANPNAVSEFGTALTRAAGRGSLACVRLLIQKHAQVNLTASSGYTSLMAAARSNHGEDCVRLLLETGADRDLKNSLNKTAFDFAIEGGSMESIRLLMPPTTQPTTEPSQSSSTR